MRNFNNKKISVKICATITAISFLISVAGTNLYAVSLAQNTTEKYEDVFSETEIISADYGTITSVKDAKSDITVINVQDLHCHPQTQKNISEIITQLAANYNLKSIYVEGGYGDIDTGWIGDIKDKKVKEQIVEKLLKEGFLTGCEYYKLFSGNNVTELKGIDEENFHKENIKRLSQIIKKQNEYKPVSDNVSKEIKLLEKRYLNTKNRKFSKITEKYFSGKTDTETFYGQLIKYVNDINKNPQKYNNVTSISLSDYPNIKSFLSIILNNKDINVKKAKSQLTELIYSLKNRLPSSIYSRLLKETENFSNKQKSLELIGLLCKKEDIDLNGKFEETLKLLNVNFNNKKINPIELVFEEKALTEQIRAALSYNEQEYDITYISDFNKYFQDYLQYKLTKQDWEYFKKGFAKFKTIYAKYSVIDRIKEMETDFALVNEYYCINDIRNEIFVKNLLRDKEPTVSKNTYAIREKEDILNGSKEIIVSVTGGFHAQALEELLYAKKVNTLTVTPLISGTVESANKKYAEIIRRQGGISNQALASTIASCTSDENKKMLLLSALKELPEINYDTVKNVLGANDKDFVSLQDSVINLEETSEVKSIIETALQQIINSFSKETMKDFLLPDTDKIMTDVLLKLIEAGFCFSDGAIYEIENSDFNGKDLNSIPAEIYSRMFSSFQKALLKIESSKYRQAISDTDGALTQDEFNILSEDTGADGYINVYLEDITENPQGFLRQTEYAIKNNKLIILNPFKNMTDVQSLSREEQIKLYTDMREKFFKLYTDKLLYEFISQPENKDYLQYDIHFFLLEILENAFVHGNKGLDKPIFVYMNLDEKNEIKNLLIYNKNSEEDDNFQVRLIRMKLALLAGQHKSNVLMKQNPYRSFEIDDNFKNKFYKVKSVIKSSADTDAIKWLNSNENNINYLSIFAPVKNQNKIFNFLSKTSPVWEEFLFRTLPGIVSFASRVFAAQFFLIMQPLFMFSHTAVRFIAQKYSGQNVSFMQIVKQDLKRLSVPTLILALPYVLTFSFTGFAYVPAVISIIIHAVINSNIELSGILKPINLRKEIKHSELPEDFVLQAKESGSKFISIYDFVRETKKLKKKDFKNNKGIEKYRARNFVHFMHKNFFEQKNRYVENSFGFALGLSYTHIFKNVQKKVNLVQAISEKHNIVSWERGYEYFYGPEYPATPPENYMDKIKELSLKYNKRIYFFLPRDLFSHEMSFKTRRELEYIQKHPEMLKNVTFVFGTYDCFNIENEEIYKKYFNEENIASTLKKLFSSPVLFFDRNVGLFAKLGSLGIVKFIKNIFNLSLNGVLKTVRVLTSLEYSKKQTVTENKQAVLRLKDDIERNNKKQVCFICTANINRSAVSHLLFEDRLLKLGVNNIKTVSAGLLPVSPNNTQEELELGRDYKKLLDKLNIDPDLIESFRSEEFSQKHFYSDYFIVASQKHKNLLITDYGIDPGKIILYSDLDGELKGDSLPDPQKLKISKLGMIKLVQTIFENSLFNFVSGETVSQNAVLLNDIVRGDESFTALPVTAYFMSVNSDEIEETVTAFSVTEKISEQSDSELRTVPILIVENTDVLKDDYALTNTGIKVNGLSIYGVEVNGALIYGTKGAAFKDIVAALNGTKRLETDIKTMLAMSGIKAEKTETESVMKSPGETIELNDGILEIGSDILETGRYELINAFLSSCLEIKNAVGIMYGQKTIIGLKTVTDSEKLRAAVYNGRARKVISRNQYERLNLSAEEVETLRARGIEIYVDDNEYRQEYEKKGISGQIIRDETGTKIRDYYTQEDMEIKEILTDKENLEDAIINQEKPVLVDISVLKNRFINEKDITNVQREFAVLLGKIKVSIKFGELNKNDIENIGYNISFAKVPQLNETEIEKLLKAQTKEEITRIIGEENEFAIMLKNIKNKEIQERFKEVITERILAKKMLTESKNELEEAQLQEKKLEILLGKMLIRRLNNGHENIKTDMSGITGANVKTKLIENIRNLKEYDEKTTQSKDSVQQQVAVNTIIEIILYYGKRVKRKDIEKQTVSDISKNYRAMLAAA